MATPILHAKRTSPACRKQAGFTLIELVMVIVLLGIVSTGVTAFLKIGTQTFINVSSRDELLSSARFSVERLNREIRDAVPSSIRIAENGAGTIECIEFTPIVASTTYTDIPVAPESASNTVTVIRFFDDDGSEYACDTNCIDTVLVYPTSAEDVYDDQSDSTGKAFPLDSPLASVDASGVHTSGTDEWLLTLEQSVLFDEDSSTQRLYLIQTPVSYCASASELTRYANYAFTDTQAVPPAATADNTALMAEYLNNITSGQAAFSFTEASLQRNALVEIELQFLKNDESIVFNNQIQIINVP